MRFSTLSAIIKGAWMIDPQWADLHAPLIFGLLSGQNVDLGLSPAQTADNVNPVQLAVRGYKVGRYTNLDRVPEGSVAIVDIVGPVVRYGECSDGLEETASLVRRLNNAGNISSIVFNVNSPGGEASGTAMFASLVKNLSKPTIGIVDDGMAASAAMWIISACDEIYATNKQSSFGSIGAYTMLPDIIKAYAAKGIPVHEIYAPQSTDKNLDYREAMKGNYEGIQASLKDLVDFFIEDVKANRAGKLNLKAGDPFTGKMFKAQDAKKIGLIDGFMSIEQAVGRAQQLSQKQSPKTTTHKMATEKKYPALANTAGWANGYEATEEGLHLTHDEAAAVDTALAQGVTDAAAVATHATAVTDHATALGAKDKQITDLTTQLAASKKDADEQRALAIKYGAQDSGKGTNTVATTDTKIEDTPPAAMHPYTAEAVKMAGLIKRK